MADELENPNNDSSLWNRLAEQQQADAENEQINQNQKLFDGFVNIETAAKQKQVALNDQRAIAGAAMMESAFRNGGMSDRSLSSAFSQAFGMPVVGGQLLDMGGNDGKVFAIYGSMKDPRTGKETIAPVGLMNGVQMMRTLQKARLGGRTADLQKYIYGDLSSRLTPEQLGEMGVRDPSAVISTGTSISGDSFRSLMGKPRERSRISSFSADGRGGFNKTEFDGATGAMGSVDYGTRDPNHSGDWKVLSVAPDPNDKMFDEEGNEIQNPNPRQIRRYQNSKTGEVISVPDGSSINEVLRGGGSEKERIERIKQENMNRRASMRQTQLEQKLALDMQKLDEQYEKRLATAKNNEEKLKILQEAKKAELEQRNKEIEAKYDRMILQYGDNKTKKEVQDKIKFTATKNDKVTVKSGDTNKIPGKPTREEARERLLRLYPDKYRIDEETGKLIRK